MSATVVSSDFSKPLSYSNTHIRRYKAQYGTTRGFLGVWGSGGDGGLPHSRIKKREAGVLGLGRNRDDALQFADVCEKYK